MGVSPMQTEPRTFSPIAYLAAVASGCVAMTLLATSLWLLSAIRESESITGWADSVGSDISALFLTPIVLLTGFPVLVFIWLPASLIIFFLFSKLGWHHRVHTVIGGFLAGALTPLVGLLFIGAPFPVLLLSAGLSGLAGAVGGVVYHCFTINIERRRRLLFDGGETAH